MFGVGGGLRWRDNEGPGKMQAHVLGFAPMSRLVGVARQARHLFVGLDPQCVPLAILALVLQLVFHTCRS